MRSLLVLTSIILLNFSVGHTAIKVSEAENNLTDASRCTATAFGHAEGAPTTPGTGYDLKVSGLSAAKVNSGSGVELSFTGITALRPPDLPNFVNADDLAGHSRSAFYAVYRCDELANTSPEWTIISDTTGQTRQVITDEDNQSALQFTDDFGGAAPDSIYYYLVVAFQSEDNMTFDDQEGRFYVYDRAIKDQQKNIVTPAKIATTLVEDADGNEIEVPVRKSLSRAFTAAKGTFDGGTEDTPAYWSQAITARVSFKPEQSHIIYNDGNSSTAQDTGIITATSTDLGAIDFGASVNQTFKTTTHQGDGSSVIWDYTLSFDDGTGVKEVITPDTLVFTATEDSLVISGNYATTNAAPGVYTLNLTATYGSGTPVSESFAWTLNPAAVDFTPIDVIIGAVEIGPENAKEFTFTRSGGFSDPTTASFVTVNWEVSSPDANLTFVSLTATGNQANFTISLPEDPDLVGQNLNFTLTMTETCAVGAPSYCETMRDTTQRELSVTALGHDFNFDTPNRVHEAAIVVDDENTYVPIYFNSNQQPDIENFMTYPFKVVNPKDSNGGPLVPPTASFSITSFIHNGSPRSITGSSVSAGGVTVSTPAAGTSDTATLSVVSAALTTNDTFVVTITAHNSAASTPESTSITIAFIALEAAAPTVTASAILDNLTDAAFDWPGGFSSTAFPVRTDAKLSIEFSEGVTNPKFKFGLSEDAQSFDSAATTNTLFSKTLNSEFLQSFIGANSTTQVGVSFSGAIDQNNVVKKNTMLEAGQFMVTLAQTPSVEPFNAETLPRDGSFKVVFTDALSVIDSGEISGDTGLNDFSVSLDTSNSLKVSPLPGRKLGRANNASLTIGTAGVYNSAGYPNITTITIPLTFAPDTDAPVLQFVSFESSDTLTHVTYVLAFNENLSGLATVSVTNITDGGPPAEFTVTPSANRLIIATNTGLGANKEYQFTVSSISDGTNLATVVLDGFITLGAEDQAEIAKVVAARANDKTPPTVFGITPDFRVEANQVNQPVRPFIQIAFSERMAESVTGSVMLSDTNNTSTGLPLTVESFDGFNLTVYPQEDLKNGSDYWISFNTATATDASTGANSLTPVTYQFRTFNPAVDNNQGPKYIGDNLSQVVERGFKPRLYFNELVDIATLASAVTIKSGNVLGQGSEVAGSWAADGSDVVFVTDGLTSGASFNYTIMTSHVTDLLGKTATTTRPYTGVFRIEGDTAIRNLSIRAVPSNATTLNVTATWLPPVDKRDITTYVLKYRKLDSNYALTSEPAKELATLSISGARLSTEGSITDFAANNSYRFTLEANGDTGLVASDSVDIIAIPGTAPEAEFVSVLSDTSIQIGEIDVDDATENALVIVKPGDLKGSTTITAGLKDNAQLQAQPGGGERYSKIAQFGPAGISFNRPVEIALQLENIDSINNVCSTADELACETALLNDVNPLFFDTESKRWTMKGLSKSRVEVLTGNNALFYARTPHFTDVQAAGAYAFGTTAPADGANLPTASVDKPYTTSIPLTGPYLNTDVTVTFSPANKFNNGFVVDTTHTGNEIIVKNDMVSRNNDDPDFLTVTVDVFDEAANTSETRIYRLPVPANRGDENAGTPKGVDSFKVSLSTSTTVDLSWDISSDDLDGVTKTIDSVYIEYYELSAGPSTLRTIESLGRTNTSTNVTVTGGKVYTWNIYTKNYKGDRSLGSTDIQKFSYGLAQTEFNGVAGNRTQLIGNTSVTVNGLTSDSDFVYISEYSEADKDALISSEVLISTTQFAGPYGMVNFEGGTLLDIDLSNAKSTVQTTPSVCYTRPGTDGDYAIYHYLQNDDNTGEWEKLSDDATAVLRAQIMKGKDCLLADANKTAFIISGRGGSNFVDGENTNPAVVIRKGGGGCSVVEGVETNTASGLLNLLLMLLPLGLIILRKFK